MDEDGYIAILRANNISDYKIIFNDLVYVPTALVQETQYVNQGDIIITMSSGSKTHVGKVAIAQKDLKCSFGAFCGKIVPFDVVPMYLYYVLCSNVFRTHIERQCKGTNINNIKQSYILDFEIDLPSTSEQERIAARIEELFSQLDASVAELKTAKERLKVYRQAVLKEAFDGVRDVCETTTIQSVCEDIKVGIVIKPAQYYTDLQSGIPAFRSANIREFHIQDRDWVYLTKAGHEANNRSEVHTDDVLIVRSGYPGTACVVPERYNGYNAIDILIAVPNTSVVLPEYLCAYTNSPYGKQLIREKKRGVAQAHLNVGGYSKMAIPIPSIDAQREVLLTLESRLSVCDSIEKAVDTALQQAAALRQSILKRAFEGEL